MSPGRLGIWVPTAAVKILIVADFFMHDFWRPLADDNLGM
jgi:hypothetical protein